MSKTSSDKTEADAPVERRTSSRLKAAAAASAVPDVAAAAEPVQKRARPAAAAAAKAKASEEEEAPPKKLTAAQQKKADAAKAKEEEAPKKFTAAQQKKADAAAAKAKASEEREEEAPPKKLTAAQQKKADAAKENQEEDAVPAPKKLTAAQQKKADAAKAKENEQEEAEPPKKLTAAQQKKADAAKAKANQEEEAVPAPKKLTAAQQKKADAAKAKASNEQEEAAPAPKKPKLDAAHVVIPVDQYYRGATGKVFEDYDAMLNQTNLGQNNNKFYKLQVIAHDAGGRFTTWTRWGRVGEEGQSQAAVFATSQQAVNAFMAKFKDKTKNKWEERENFVKHGGKYQLLEMDYTQDASKFEGVDIPRRTGEEDEEILVAESKLDAWTQWFVKLIFNKDMFQESLVHLKVDTSRLPLGMLSKQQIREGNRVLSEMMAEIDTGRPSAVRLRDLSSEYYTLIPTATGRNVPPTLSSAKLIQEKFDLLAVLEDMERATEMRQNTEKRGQPARATLKPNPVDELYDTLKCGLEYVNADSDAFKRISTYAKNTGNRKLLHCWSIKREGESSDSAFHDDLTNRKLLWHGTNAAVVAAILQSGLRIMPHSGGRVGRGIYLASEHGKSAGYVWAASIEGKRVGIMFLAEAALGKEHHIKRDDPSLRKAPKGFDCVVALGQQDPDPALDVVMKIDGRDVVVPQGPPVRRAEHQDSSFFQNEFLLYDESQHKLRFVLAFEW